MLPFLIQLSENDKRIIVCFLILLIFIFVLIGLLALLIEKIMKKFGNRSGIMMRDVVKAKVVNNRKDFMRVGNKMNNQIYLKQSLIGFGLLLLAMIVYLIYGTISKNFSFVDLSKGFGTLFFQWNFNDPDIYVKWFDIYIIGKWPPLVNTPHFEAKYWGSYVVYPLMLTGGIWMLIATQAHMARFFRLRKISNLLYRQSIDPTQQNNINNQTNNSINNNNNNTNNN